MVFKLIFEELTASSAAFPTCADIAAKQCKTHIEKSIFHIDISCACVSPMGNARYAVY